MKSGPKLFVRSVGLGKVRIIKELGVPWDALFLPASLMEMWVEKGLESLVVVNFSGSFDCVRQKTTNFAQDDRLLFGRSFRWYGGSGVGVALLY